MTSQSSGASPFNSSAETLWKAATTLTPLVTRSAACRGGGALLGAGWTGFFVSESRFRWGGRAGEPRAEGLFCRERSHGHLRFDRGEGRRAPGGVPPLPQNERLKLWGAVFFPRRS